MTNRLNKYIFICLTFGFIVSCSEDNYDYTATNVVDEEPETNVDLNIDEKRSIPSWIDTIILNSRSRSLEYQCSYETRNSLQAIDTVFLKKHLMGFKIDFPQNWEFEFNPYSRYYFFDFQKLDSCILFTIMNNTEYGYDNYYAYTFDLNSNRITTVSCIAKRGVDGGAINEEHLSFSGSGNKLTVFSQSYFDEDLLEEGEFTDCYTRSFDSIISKFYFYPNKTEYSIDSVYSSLDTICR